MTEVARGDDLAADLAALARLRQAMYRLFAVAFMAPTPDRLAGLQAGADLVADAGVEAFAFANAWSAFEEQLARVDLILLAQEHVRLFDAGVDGALCPPVESFHLASARDGGTAELLARLERSYARVGLGTTRGSVGLPDHVTVELEAMSVLCGREHEARVDGDTASVWRAVEAQQVFLDDHIGRWVPRFAERMRAVAGLDHHRLLADAVTAFVQHDLQVVPLLAQPPVVEVAS